MTQGTPGDSPDGWAPWGSRERMVLMAVVGPLLAVVLLAVGIYLIASGRNGQSLTVIGGVLAVVWIVAIPLARRRHKI
jgi:hypothetical protein